MPLLDAFITEDFVYFFKLVFLITKMMSTYDFKIYKEHTIKRIFGTLDLQFLPSSQEATVITNDLCIFVDTVYVMSLVFTLCCTLWYIPYRPCFVS